jgi:hypothetical protein
MALIEITEKEMKEISENREDYIIGTRYCGAGENDIYFEVTKSRKGHMKDKKELMEKLGQSATVASYNFLARTFKIRAYETDNGNMYYSDRDETNGEKPIEWFWDSTGLHFEEWEFDNWADPDSERMHLKHTPQILMQAIGCKDMKGIDIYEGDICQIGNMIPEFKPTLIVIEFRNGGWGWVAGKKFVGISNHTDLDTEKDLLIVGNIFETPEIAPK